MAQRSRICLQCRGRWRLGLNPWVGRIPLEEEMATHLQYSYREVPWTEEPCGLQSVGSQRVGQD